MPHDEYGLALRKQSMGQLSYGVQVLFNLCVGQFMHCHVQCLVVSVCVVNVVGCAIVGVGGVVYFA